MEFVAGLLTCIQAALSTCQTLYDIVQTIKEGNSQVQRLLMTVELVRSILLDVQTSATSLDNESADILHRSMVNCSRDMSLACIRLRKLFVLPDDGKITRAWKSAQLMIQKEELEKLDEYIHRHVSHLYIKVAMIRLAGCS